MARNSLDKGSGAFLCNIARNLHLAALATVLLATPAYGQICDTRDGIKAQLERRFGERLVGLGISNAGALVELLTSGPAAPRQTWSIIVTLPGGPTCLRAAGEGWREIKPAPDPDPET